MTWRHCSMNSRPNLPASVSSERAFKQSFFLRFRPDKMENHCECSSRLRSGGSGNCWGTAALFSGVEAISLGFHRPVWLCRNHAKNLKGKVRSEANCCFPSTEDKCSANNANLVPCPQRILNVVTQLEKYRGGTFICNRHLNRADKDPAFTSHEDYKPPASRKVKVKIPLHFFLTRWQTTMKSSN